MSPKCHFRGNLLFLKANLSSNERWAERLGGKPVFLSFAPRRHLTLSEIRPKDLLENVSENVCCSLQHKFGAWRVFGAGEEGTKEGTIGERQRATAAVKVSNLHRRQAIKALRSHLSYFIYICLSAKFLSPTYFILIIALV